MTHAPATPAELELSAYAAELAALQAQPCLFDDDTARLPVLAAALGWAVRVVRVDWRDGWETVRETVTVIGKAGE